MRDPGTLTVPLSVPLAVAGIEVSSITIRAPTIEELGRFSPFRVEPSPGGGVILRQDGEALIRMLIACIVAPAEVVDGLLASPDVRAAQAMRSAMLVLCAPGIAHRFAEHLAPEHRAALAPLN